MPARTEQRQSAEHPPDNVEPKIAAQRLKSTILSDFRKCREGFVRAETATHHGYRPPFPLVIPKQGVILVQLLTRKEFSSWPGFSRPLLHRCNMKTADVRCPTEATK